MSDASTMSHSAMPAMVNPATMPTMVATFVAVVGNERGEVLRVQQLPLGEQQDRRHATASASTAFATASQTVQRPTRYTTTARIASSAMSTNSPAIHHGHSPGLRKDNGASSVVTYAGTNPM